MGELMSDIVMNVMAEPEFLIVDVSNYLPFYVTFYYYIYEE